MFAYSYEQWHSGRFRDVQAREWLRATKRAREEDGAWVPPLDARILAQGPFRLYYARERLDEEAAVLRTLRYRMVILDASRFTTTGAFHAKARLMMGHHGVYEETLEGFAEALRMLPFSPFGRAALVFHHFDVFVRHCGALAEDVLDIILQQARYDLVRGRRLLALLQSDSETLDVDPFAVPAADVDDSILDTSTESAVIETVRPPSSRRSGFRMREAAVAPSHDTIIEPLIKFS